MSGSERPGPEGLAGVATGDLVAEIAARAERGAAGGADPVDEPVVRDLVTAAVRLYAARTQATGVEFAPATGAVTATDAVTVVCALLRQQDLDPFDLALWFGRSSTGRTR